ELQHVAPVLDSSDLERLRATVGAAMLRAEHEEDGRAMWDPEAIGLELTALAGLDRDLGMGELDAVLREREPAGKAPADLRDRLEPDRLFAAKEGVRDRQGQTADRKQGRYPQEVVVAGLKGRTDASLGSHRPRVENLVAPA